MTGGRALLGGKTADITLGGCGRRWPTGINGEETRFDLFSWDTYAGETTLADFRATTGVDVRMSLFGSNDELFSKLRAGNPGDDVVGPSNEFVQRLAVSDLLQFRDLPFDPGRRLSMPDTWLVMGIGYRESRVDSVPDSWTWVFDSDRQRTVSGCLPKAMT